MICEEHGCLKRSCVHCENEELHKEINLLESHQLTDKQLSIINWMFNYCRIEMIERNDEYSYSDIEKLSKYIVERFPGQSDEILKLYEV